ncbi:hypothetical protein [Streptomyces sp. DH12]|uniref:hypothetical protein n=1 Tax=Streptomyces sp. DH12 TaxID=2857010 RepID=UPI001E3C2C79|nr:hypothetical protein [Streptomyces sp. DH12]
MSQTGSTLRAARQLLLHYGLTDADHPHYASIDGRLTPQAAIYRAATGTLPPEFLTDPDKARHLLRHNPRTWDCIRWVSVVLHTEPGTDTATGQPDLISHIDNWCADPDPFTGRRPTLHHVVDLLHFAATTADTLTDTAPAIPAPRTAA